MSEHNEQQNRQWWLGFLDLASESTAVVADRLEWVHLSIADETFDILERVPATRPVSEPIRDIHHGIFRLSYGAVAFSARSLNRFVRAGLSGNRHSPD